MTDEQKPNLKPCPFCGSKDCSIIEDGVDGAPAFFASCPSCAAEGPWHDTSAGALRAWNKRLTDTTTAQMAEALDCCREWFHDGNGDCDGSCREDEDGKACLLCLVIEALADYREEKAP